MHVALLPLVLILRVIILVAGLPRWPYAANWGA
jgi:hypothetical protein